MINFSELKAHPRYTCAAIMLMIAIWGSAYWAVKIESNRIHEGAIEKAENFSKFFEDQTLKIFHYADSYVKLIRLEYQDHGDLDKIKILMQEAPLDTSMASHVTIIDENGTPVLVSGHKIKPGSSAKDREYFKFQKQAQKDSLFISNAHTGRNTGKTTLRLVRHIIKSNGDFGGVVFAAVEDKQIVAFFNALNMDENSSATLVGTDKLIRARTSYGQVGPGQDISGSRIWKELEQSPSGVYLQKSVVDQITRYYAYRKLDKFPMVIAIGMLTEEILDNISEFKYTAIVIASLLSIAFLILFILIRREALANSKIQKANAEVMAANLAKSEFLAHMSHELRTPLNSIIGFSQVMG